MRKRLIDPAVERLGPFEQGWLDLERAAVVEVTSEDKEFPIELVFHSEEMRGWRAAAPGNQTIRLIFDHPQKLKCVFLVFEETEIGRTQEFVVRWYSDGSSTPEEIVRQQWNFSPPESIREVEQYRVDLHNLKVLELVIKPDISGGAARASLRNFRLS